MPTKTGNRFPHPTTVELTKTLLLQYAQQVASLGLKQIEVCDKRERGLRAIIYASGRVFFHARYFFAHRSRHKKLGEFGLLTIEQARAANRTVRTMLAQGGDPKQERRGRITLRDFFTQHFTEHCGRKTSFATDISRAKRLLKEFGDLYLTDFDGTMLARFLNTLKKEGLASATIANYLSLIKTIFDLAVSLGFLDASPARMLKAPRKDNKTTRVMSSAELASCVAEALRYPVRPHGIFIAVQALTAMRPGELLKCTRKNVDLTRKVIRLSTSKSGHAGVIHLSDLACQLLGEQMASHTEYFVFPSLRNGKGPMSSPSAAFRTICATVGLSGYTLHSLRHAWASHVGHTYSNVVAQHGLRHQSAKTSELYVHPLADSLWAAAESVAELVCTYGQ